MAKKGSVLTHHFSHVADTNCNPSPETLTHRYAKELIGRRLLAIEPAFELRLTDKSLEAWARQPTTIFQADKAIVEPKEFLPEFAPDVLLSCGALKMAVEVHFRHPVPSNKVELIEKRYLHAVEVDLSDLPDNAGPDVIGAALDDPRRWKWLNNRSALHSEIANQLRTCSRLYIPKLKDLSEMTTPTCSSPQIPHKKILAAQARLALAHEWLARPKASRSAYSDLSADEKLALHCIYVGIEPVELPLHLMQTVRGQSLLGRVHCMYWQTWFFAKFCVGTQPLNLRHVVRTARQTYLELAAPSRTLQSENGFCAVSELFYEFLLQLALQGLLQQHNGPKAWLHTFSPKAGDRAAARALLTAFPAASA